MIYQNFQAYSDMAGPVRAIADIAANVLAHPLPGLSRNGLHRAGAALCAVVARAGLNHQRPPFGINTVEIDGQLKAVRETAVHRTPFCTLLHLEKTRSRYNPGSF
jgi:poly-beta-hydroxyalkanoate depolymerase